MAEENVKGNAVSQMANLKKFMSFTKWEGGVEMQTRLEIVLIEGILLSRSCSHLTWNGVKALALPNPSRTELSFHIHTRLGGSEEPRDRPATDREAWRREWQSGKLISGTNLE